MSKRRAKRPSSQRKQQYAVRVMSPRAVAEKIRKQREQRRLERQKQKALKAARLFRARKADRGKIVFVGIDGDRKASEYGRKGFTIFVNNKGKKEIIKHRKTGYGPYKISEVEFPLTKTHAAARKAFLTSRRKLTGSGKAVVKAKGIVKPTGIYDFSDKVVTKIAKNLKKAFDSQLAHRRFIVNALVLIRLPDGTTRVIQVEVPISKADHIAIELAGMENFVKFKFYAFMARQLAFDGFVTSGSANHVRRMKENKGAKRNEWTKDGQKWEGWDYETVRIEQIEWKIEQMK
jgi:hypothetical protein